MRTNSVLQRGDGGFEEMRSGFNQSVAHDPELIVDASSARDVARAVSCAGRARLPVAVMNTGHGPSAAADGALLVRTARMNRVSIDSAHRTARVEAGVRWADVIDAAARHGLAPLNGSSPHVGAVGYTLGGGVGLLGRRFGFAADHVRSFDLITADGRLRHVTSGTDADLFWAARGAGANFGVVTAMEIELFPVTTLLGGELCFGPDVSEDVIDAYVDWAQTLPDEMASSLMLLAYPADAPVASELQGRHITHLRLAYSGDDHREGRALVAKLRRAAPPLVDSVREMPYADVGTIHHEPTDTPVAAFDRNVLLADADHDAAAVVAKLAGPQAEAPFLTELRAWGGALSRPGEIPSAVGCRDTAFSLLAISDATIESRARRDELLHAMEPWATGLTYLNFCGVEDTATASVERCYQPDDYARLRRLKTCYDPTNTFRINFNIPPERSTQ